MTSVQRSKGGRRFIVGKAQGGSLNNGESRRSRRFPSLGPLGHESSFAFSVIGSGRFSIFQGWFLEANGGSCKRRR